jgi:hypothetical protein
VGLYSVPGSDIVSTLLDVVGNLSQTAGSFVPLPAAGPALDVAKVVYNGFGSLLGLNSLQPLAQAENGRALPESGSGYFVVANAAPQALAGLKVRKGILCRNNDMVTDFDYCLVAIERHATVLEEATKVAPDLFDDGWQQVVAALGGDDPTAPKVALRKLLAAVRASPALIDSDRAAAMAAYFRRYTEEVALADQLKGGDVTRGARDELAAGLSEVRDQQEQRQNHLVAQKLSTIFELIDKAQPALAPSEDQKKRPLTLAETAQARKALLEVGEGGDAALADALLRAV